MHIRSVYIAFLLLLASCVKEADWPLQTGNLTQIYVSGIVTDQRGKQTIRISLPVETLNDPAPPVTGANVLITNEDSTFQLTEQPAGSGEYRTDSGFLAVPGKNYTLLVFYQDQVFSGKSSMEPGVFFDPLRYVRDQVTGLYHIDYVASVFATDQAAMWEILLNWSQVPGYESADTSLTHARLLFYTLPTLDVSQVFAPRVEQVFFPAGTLVTERRYSLTSEHAEYIREVLLETSWQGGLFSEAPATVTTNMSAGAGGYFAACGMTSLSLTITP
jgi:hypothetical protein